MLRNTKLAEDGDVKKYVDKVNNLTTDLITAGEILDNANIADAIMEGLPEFYVTDYIESLRNNKDALIDHLL
ncbi:MAG: hypothetical protein M1840_006757 [Geoglossum simile]|nr:MAG: hypothetical protein M1840_006757 [Geoglossum simile]